MRRLRARHCRASGAWYCCTAARSTRTLGNCRMMSKTKFPFLLAATLLLPGETFANAPQFSPCPDSGVFTELEGSLCDRYTLPLRAASGAADLSRKTVEIFVRKFPASKQARGTLWLVSGGPGESGATFYPFLGTLRAALPDFDLLIPDHRGTGYSTHLCPEEEAPDSAGGLMLVGEEWAACWNRLNGAPDYARAFSITNAARDLAALINYYSVTKPVYIYCVSYGTQLALRTLSIGPLPVQGIIFDSLVPPEGSTKWDLSQRSRSTDDVGRLVLRHCDASPTCRARAGGSAHGGYERLLAEQDQALLDQIPGENLKIFFGGVLDLPAARNRIPDLIRELGRGEVKTLESVKHQMNELTSTLGRYPQSPPSIPLVSIISGSENNARPALTKAEVATEQKALLFASLLPAHLISPGLPLYPRDRYFEKSPTGLPRTLVLQGTLDPKTPIEGAKAHVATLRKAGNIAFIPVNEAPHFILLTSPACFIEAVQEFLGGGRIDAPACATPLIAP
jgi:pimeloyl-ACP methyl ester carboxylesterase